MPKLTFLNLGEVLEIHRDQIVRYGGLPGLRDLDLLKSAVAMSQATFDGTFLHTDIFEMAAAYLFHIVGNHPFLDGNKRVGAVACLVFLELNGYEFTAPEKETRGNGVCARPRQDVQIRYCDFCAQMDCKCLSGG